MRTFYCCCQDLSLDFAFKLQLTVNKHFNWVILTLGFLFLLSCSEEQSIDSLLQTMHEAMQKQDSLMKVAHDKLRQRHSQWHNEYELALKGKVDTVHQKLEEAHTVLLDKHDDIIDKHEVIIRMHKRLIEKYQNGKFDRDFIEEEHRLLEEEHELMRLDHDRLLADHEKMEKDHREMIASLGQVLNR